MSASTQLFNLVPTWLVQGVHWFSGFVVLAEALNKLERTDLLAPGLGCHDRLVVLLKVFAWMLLALGAAGALVTPLLHLERPSLQDALVILGFAVLIVRSRLKEADHEAITDR